MTIELSNIISYLSFTSVLICSISIFVWRNKRSKKISASDTHTFTHTNTRANKNTQNMAERTTYLFLESEKLGIKAKEVLGDI